MERILKYINNEIDFHQNFGYETDFDTAFYWTDNEQGLYKMYDVGRYDTLLQVKKKIEELIKDGK